MTEQKVLILGETDKPRFFYGWLIISSTFLITMVAFGTFFTFGVFLESVLLEFNWTRTMTSGAFSICMLLQGFLSIGMGRLTDKFGPRMVITASGVFLGWGYLLMSQISAIWQLYLFYGVMIAIGMSPAFVTPSSTIARWFAKKRGMMTGIVLSGSGIGTMIMPPVASRLVSNYGWRTSYTIVGIIAFVLIVVASQFLKRDPSQVRQMPYGADERNELNLCLETDGFSLQEAIHTKQFWILCAMFFCSLFCVYVIMVHIVIHAIGLGISTISAANIVAVMGALNIVGRIMMGSVGDRIGNKLALMIIFIAMSVALFWVAVVMELWMIYVSIAIFGIAQAGVSALLSPMAAELFRLRSHGAILGTITFCGTIGGAIGPVMAGRIFDITNSYQLAFLVCAGFGVIGFVMVFLLRPLHSRLSLYG